MSFRKGQFTMRLCLIAQTAATCTCGSSGDYFGDTCSKKFSDSCTDGCNDPSNPDPCKNGATCKMCDIDGFGIVVVPLCKCAVGFSGDVCEVVARPSVDEHSTSNSTKPR